MIRIKLRTIPAKKMRYPGVGDYWGDLGGQEIRVVEMHNPRFEWLVGVHEMVESGLAAFANIHEEDITAFDMAYEETRRLGLLAPCGCRHYEEPGNDPHAPYYELHQIATIVERLLATRLGIHWPSYNAKLNEGEE